jgi:hypothetical protein
MDDKLGGLVTPPEWQLRLDGLLSVVVKGSDYATVVFAVTFEIDVTLVRRAVVSIDKVKVL